MFIGKKPAPKPTEIPQGRTGKLTVEAAIVKRGEVLSSESRSERLPGPITGDIAAVSGNIGVTINTGNYESLRIDIGATIPANTEDIVTGVAHLNLYQILEARLQKYSQEAKRAFVRK